MQARSLIDIVVCIYKNATMATGVQNRCDARGPLHRASAGQLLSGHGQTDESDRRRKTPKIRLHWREDVERTGAHPRHD